MTFEGLRWSMNYEPEQLLTAKDVQRSLRCSLALVYRWADQGRLPCVRIPCPGNGRQKSLVRFKHSDLVEFIDRHYRATT